MNADPRRFHYPLEPVLRQRRWELEALQARLGRVVQDVQRAERVLEDLRQRYRRDAERAASALSLRPDPVAHRAVIAWLERLREKSAVAEDALARLRCERSSVTAACAAAQRNVEVLDRHRDECVDEFRCDEERRLATDADREWLSRRGWRATRIALPAAADGGPNR